MGIIYKNGNIYSGSNTVALTQADYDALSQVEKENGTIYFIADGTNVPTIQIIDDEIETIPITCTSVSGGTLTCTAQRYGKVLYLYFIGVNSAAASTGTNPITATFNGPTLTGPIMCMGYYGGTTIIIQVTAANQIYVRTIGATLAANSNFACIGVGFCN